MAIAGLSMFRLMLGPRAHICRNMLDGLQAGERAQNNCLGPAYQRRDWQGEGPIQALTLTFHLPDGRPPGEAEFKRTQRAGAT